MWLLLIALFGLVVPNGLFLYWAAVELSSFGEVLANRLALAFMIDALMALCLLSYLFAVRPIGEVRWPWFVLFSLVGGLGFGIPFYVWLNRRPGSRREPP